MNSRPIVSYAEFNRWLERARPGERLVYHIWQRGRPALDALATRERDYRELRAAVQMAAGLNPAKIRLDKVQPDDFRRHYRLPDAQPFIDLAQRRADDRVEYIAIRRRVTMAAT